jgi:hypothetical protein
VVITNAICFSYSLIQKNEKSNIQNFVKFTKTQTFHDSFTKKLTNQHSQLYPTFQTHKDPTFTIYFAQQCKPTNISWFSPWPILYKNRKTQLIK